MIKETLIIFILIIIASVWFHIWSPWWWTPVASNWGNIDTIMLEKEINKFEPIITRINNDDIDSMKNQNKGE